MRSSVYVGGGRTPVSYGLGMHQEQDTEELKELQLQREADEQERGRSAPGDPETAQHERRADKARYLRKKLEQREASEREQHD
jgi:hypothetical protein